MESTTVSVFTSDGKDYLTALPFVVCIKITEIPLLEVIFTFICDMLCSRLPMRGPYRMAFCLRDWSLSLSGI